MLGTAGGLAYLPNQSRDVSGRTTQTTAPYSVVFEIVMPLATARPRTTGQSVWLTRILPGPNPAAPSIQKGQPSEISSVGQGHSPMLADKSWPIRPSALVQHCEGAVSAQTRATCDLQPSTDER